MTWVVDLVAGIALGLLVMVLSRKGSRTWTVIGGAVGGLVASLLAPHLPFQEWFTLTTSGLAGALIFKHLTS